MSRRGNGEGSIYQRADGKWCGQAMLAGKRHTVYGKTRREAQQKPRQVLSNADRGIMPAPEKVTFGDYLTRWLNDVASASLRPTTFETYEWAVRLYLVPELGRLKLTQLQPAHLQGLYTALLKKGLAPKTVRNVHGVAHRALTQAVAWGIVPRNVAEAVEPPQVKRHEMRTLTPEQIRSLLDAARGTRWAALLTLAITTGMRQGELLGLRWRDVNLDAGEPHVQRQWARNRQFTEPKTAKGRRKIDLPASAVRSLREHDRMQREERVLLGPEYEDNDLVFSTYQGKPIPVQTLTDNLKRLLRKAGCPEIRFHDLRHTAATLLLLQGIHPKVVQERLGHSTIGMTLDTYSHVLPGMGREAADRLDQLLR